MSGHTPWAQVRAAVIANRLAEEDETTSQRVYRFVQDLYERFLWQPWVKKCKTIAARDPEWAQLEREQTERWEDMEFDALDAMQRQFEIEERMCPKPWWLKHRVMHRFQNFHPINQAKMYHSRATKGWSPRDTWSLDYYISHILVDALPYLRDSNFGYPDGLTEDGWKQILNDMTAGFEAAIAINNMNYSTEPWYNELEDDARWDRVREWNDEKNAVFDKGMKLFHEYYFSLWS